MKISKDMRINTLFLLISLLPIHAYSQDSLNVQAISHLYECRYSFLDAVVSGNYLYAAPDVNVHNIEDPSEPTYIRAFGSGGFDYEIINDYLISLDKSSDSNPVFSLKVYDLLIPESPALVNELILDSNADSNPKYWIQEDRIYYYKQNGDFLLFDLADPLDVQENRLTNFDDLPLDFGVYQNMFLVAFESHIDMYFGDFSGIFASIQLSDTLRGMAIVGDYCYWCDRSHYIHIHSLSYPGIFQEENVVETYNLGKIFEKGNMLFTINHDPAYPACNVIIYNLSNPINPEYMWSTTVGNFKNIDIVEDDLYITYDKYTYESEEGMRYVIDSRDMIALYERTSGNSFDNISQIYSDTNSDKYDLVVSENLACFLRSKYMRAWDYYEKFIFIVDISDLSNPTEIKLISEFHNNHPDVFIKDYTIFYNTSRYSYRSPNKFMSIDFSNPSHPDTLFLLPTEEHGFIKELSGSTMISYLESEETIRIYNYTNEMDLPELVGTYHYPIQGYDYHFKCSNDRVYISKSTGIQILDISDPTDPFLLMESEYQTGCTNEKIDIIDNIAYILEIDEDENDKIEIIDFSNPSNPQIINTLDLYHKILDMDIQNDRLYVMCESFGPRIFDLNDLTELTEMGYYREETKGLSLKARDNYLFTVGKRFNIYDCSDALGIEDEPGMNSSGFETFIAYPNPSNAQFTLSFNLPKSGLLRCDIYNLLGQKVGLTKEILASTGSNSILFDADQLSSGTYFVNTSLDGEPLGFKKITLLK